jgi:argininosuccinate lyase
MQTAADSPYMVATDLAEWLVEHGMPFRKAHAVVGGLVREALSGTGSLADLVAIHADLGPDAAALVSQGVPVERRTTPGGGGPRPVAAQLEAFAQHLASTRGEGGDPGEAPAGDPPAGSPPAEAAAAEDADTD